MLIILIEWIPRVVMINEASAVSFRQNLSDMLNQVQYRHDSIVIKRDGKPVAALVDARLFEWIEAGYAEVAEAEGLAEIDVAVAASLGVVLDTNVLLSGLAYLPGVPFRLIASLLAWRDRYPIRTPAEFWAEHGGP